MQNLIFVLISFLIASFAFGYGALKLFKKGKPMYMQLLVCASGCLALQQFSYMVNLWCGVAEPVSTGMLGVLGCNFFLFSANFGTLDKIVDESTGFNKIRAVSVLAPAVLSLLTAYVFYSWKDKDLFCAVMWIVMLIPALPASYFNLKHLLLPTDPFRFLEATKLSNIAALGFYTVTEIYLICSAAMEAIVTGILSVLMSGSVLILSLCAVKGAKRWGI